MTQETILANATLILGDEVTPGSVQIRDGAITAVDPGRQVPRGAVDCQEEYLAPGLVELHTDNLERHIEPRPGVAWPHNAAIIAHDAELAGCGITTVFDAMRVGSIPSGRGGHKKYARALSRELLGLGAANALKISHYLHLRAEVCSETLLEEMAEFDRTDRVGIVSLMDHTPGQRQFSDMVKFKAYVMGKRGLTEDQFSAHVDQLMDLRARFGEIHETGVVSEANRFGAVLASHDDTTETQVRTSAGYGIQLAEFPTTVAAARACRDHDIAVIMGAPNLIRGASHSGNVAAHELAELGLLNILSSDYVPAALLLSAVTLGDLWGDLARGMATVTATPARYAGLSDRGELAVGKRADLIRFGRQGRTPMLRAVWSRGRRVA